MIYRCEKCKKEIVSGKGSKFCPHCGSKIVPIDIKERVAELFNSGMDLKKIESELHLREITLVQILANLAANNKISDTFVQKEYEDEILAIMNADWDNKLKTVKEQLPEECNYITIYYYAYTHRKAAAIERRQKKDEQNMQIRSMLKKGEAIENIVSKTGSNIYTVERILVEEIAKDKAVANPYINNEYKTKIMEIVNDPEWDNKLRTIKDQLPEEASYTCIKATIAKYK